MAVQYCSWCEEKQVVTTHYPCCSRYCLNKYNTRKFYNGNR